MGTSSPSEIVVIWLRSRHLRMCFSLTVLLITVYETVSDRLPVYLDAANDNLLREFSVANKKL